MAEQFQNFMENIESKLYEESKGKIEQYSQEVLANLETKIDTIFQNKTKALEETLKIKLKKEKELFYEQSNTEFDQKCVQFEQRLTLKLEEMIEKKSEELSVKFEAQLIQELAQVTGVIQQMLNNGLDLEKQIENQLNIKLQQCVEDKKEELNKAIEEEVAKKMSDSTDTLLNDKLQDKVDVGLEQILARKFDQLHLKLEKQVNMALKQVLEGKMKLLNLNTEDITLESSETYGNNNKKLEENNIKNHETEKKVDKRVEQNINELNDIIKTLQGQIDG